MKKIVIAGAWRWPIYQEACADALNDLGIKVIKYSWDEKFSSLIGKLEHYTCLPFKDIYNLNNELLELCKQEKPEYILIWSCRFLFNNTLIELKKMGITTISYNNDDPFNKRKVSIRRIYRIYQKVFWWRFKSNIPYFDINFVYREKNVKDYIGIGGKNVNILHAYYVPSMNYIDVDDKYLREGVFIGHYEDDERASTIKHLRDEGFNVDLFGTGWDECKKYSKYFTNINSVHGIEYNRIISSSKFALCFFSKINNDSYTRRVFEITSASTLLVAPYNKTIAKFFEDGEEALLYKNINDLTERLKKLLNNSKELKRIASNGRERCLRSGYDVKSRMSYFLDVIDEYESSNEVLRL
jgi:glycosyltransferase involved in cell wall biosynthesis